MKVGDYAISTMAPYYLLRIMGVRENRYCDVMIVHGSFMIRSHSYPARTIRRAPPERIAEHLLTLGDTP